MRTQAEIKTLTERIKILKSQEAERLSCRKRKHQENIKELKKTILEVVRNLLELDSTINMTMKTSFVDFIRFDDNITLNLNYELCYQFGDLKSVEISTHSLNSNLGDETNKKKFALISHLFNRFSEINFVELFNNNEKIVEITKKLEDDDKHFQDELPEIENLQQEIKTLKTFVITHYKNIFEIILRNVGYTFKTPFTLDVKSSEDWRRVKFLKICKISPKFANVFATQEFKGGITYEKNSKARFELVFEQAFRKYFEELELGLG